MRNEARLLVLLAVAVGGTGCGSSKECSSIGCLTPIIVTASLTRAAAGVYTATFCKRGECQSALLDLSVPSQVSAQGAFLVRFQSDPTDTGITITASVLGASSFEDGESLSFTVKNESEGEIVHWSERATYDVVHDIGGPGCGDCFSLRATVGA